jgi:hypothetical protein
MNERTSYQASKLTVRAEQSGEKYIEGYFAVFEQETALYEGCFEKIARGAFDDALKSNDIRCLFNHDTGYVLGRTGSGTLELKTDAHGLWGRVKINQNDPQALAVYARVERGDISGCSFGFTPVLESYEEKPDGLHWTVEKADVAEVSICTFPAYPQTQVQARAKDIIKFKKANLKKRLEAIKC